MTKDQKNRVSYLYGQVLQAAVSPDEAQSLRGKLENILDSVFPDAANKLKADVRIGESHYYIGDRKIGSIDSGSGQIAVLMLTNIGRSYTREQLEEASGLSPSGITGAIFELRRDLFDYSKMLVLVRTAKNPSRYAVVERNSNKIKIKAKGPKYQ